MVILRDIRLEVLLANLGIQAGIVQAFSGCDSCSGLPPGSEPDSACFVGRILHIELPHGHHTGRQKRIGLHIHISIQLQIFLKAGFINLRCINLILNPECPLGWQIFKCRFQCLFQREVAQILGIRISCCDKYHQQAARNRVCEEVSE